MQLFNCQSVKHVAEKRWQKFIQKYFASRNDQGGLVAVLDSGAERPGFKSQTRCCWVTVLGKLFTPLCLCSPSAKLVAVAALLRAVAVTACLAESNGSLPPGLWLTLPAGWLPRTRISCRTLRSVIEYGLPFYRNGLCKLLRYIVLCFCKYCENAVNDWFVCFSAFFCIIVQCFVAA